MATGMERTRVEQMKARARRANAMPANNKPSPGSLAAFDNKERPGPSSYGPYGGKSELPPRKGENAYFKGQNLNKFISEINKRGGLYKPNLYFVMINVPAGLGGYPDKADDDAHETLMYMCNSAALPGAQMLTSDYKRQGYGTFDRRPFGVQVTDIPLTFFVDNQGNLMKFFHKWMDIIVHYHQGGAEAGEHAEKPGGYQKFEVGYRSDYITTIDIFCFNQQADHIMKYTLYEAFPIQMGDITVAWAETDSFSILPVQFTFRTYDYTQLPEIEYPDDRPEATWSTGDVAGKSGPQPTARSMNIVGALSNIVGTIGLIKGAINTPLSVGSAINIVNNTKLVSGSLTNIL